MKTKYFIFAAIAGMTFASCSNDDFASDSGPTTVGQTSDGSINFGFNVPNATRADIVGNAAASLLGNNFYVTGTKGTEAATSPTPTLVFDNYLVHYGVNTAGTTESNTANWEYVGVTPGTSPYADYVKLGSYSSQTIKFWDYSVPQYDFLAFSTGTYAAVSGASTAATNIGVTKMQYGANLASSAIAYTFDMPSVDALKNTYITDITEVAKANYGNEVTLQFKNLGSKVRLALYETIPGYAVKDVKFYQVDGTNDFSGTKSTTATLISANSNGLPTNGTIQVFFPHVGNDNATKQDYNKAAGHVTSGSSYTKYKGFGTLENFASTKEGTEADGDYLGRTLPTATFAGSKAADYYEIMFPVSSSDPLTLRVDYTLVATDGSAEEIKIYGAKAIVPSTYTKWEPNYAYTYIFKISDNTNGWTDPSGSDPAGLFPITFDAVVKEATDATGEQTTITTVATPSITTYQQNHDPLKPQNEYSKATNKNVYVQVMDNNKSPSVLVGTGTSSLYKLNTQTSDATPVNRSALYKVSDNSATEAKVMDALENRTTALTVANVTGRNKITLTKVTSSGLVDNSVTSIVNGVDDNPITVGAGEAAQLKIPSISIGTYAYVYDYSSAAKNTTTIYQPVTAVGTLASGVKYVTTGTLNTLTSASDITDGSEVNTDADFYDYVYFSKTTNGTDDITYSFVSVDGKNTLPAGLIKCPVGSLSTSGGTVSASSAAFVFTTYVRNDGKYAVKIIKVVD